MKLTIRLEPRTKKNHQRIIWAGSRPKIVQSTAYQAYEKECLTLLAGKAPEEPISYAVNVKCVYYMPTRRRVDLTNLLEATDDILVAAGFLEDDNAKVIAGHDGSRVRYDRNNPRTEITIERMQEHE